MNLIYRTLFNRSTGTRQAVSELARSARKAGGGGAAGVVGTRHRLSAVAGACLLAVGLSGPGLTWAEGGRGGNGYADSVAGGAGGSDLTPAGSAGAGGSLGVFFPGGGGGGGATVLDFGSARYGDGAAGGAGGLAGAAPAEGAGGASGRRVAADETVDVSTAGANGGAGRVPSVLSDGYADGGGGGGGGGGSGIVATRGALQVSAGAVVAGGEGGAGGRAGTADFSWGGGGGGGQGGAGLLLAGGGQQLLNGGTLRGGTGGSGGAADVRDGASGGSGGDGGIGLRIVSSGVTVTNTGVIQGGAGGVPGEGTSGTGGAGRGGVGISGSSLTVINSGTISGGLAGDGGARADAVVFTSGTNTLELRAGSQITGNVVGFKNAEIEDRILDTLALGGDAGAGGVPAVFDASRIGATAQYRNFAMLEKRGTGTWTLTGTSTDAPLWLVRGGTLAVGGDGSLGPAGASVYNATLRVDPGAKVDTRVLTFFGGTLDNAGAITVTRRFQSVDGDGPFTLHNHSGGSITVALGASNPNLELIGAGSTVLNEGAGTRIVSAAGDALLMHVGSVTNTGGALIQGSGAGVSYEADVSVSNGAGSTIRGGTGSVRAIDDARTAAATLHNAGTLGGNVQLNAGSVNHVTLVTGSVIQGNLGIGTNAASTLVLTGDEIEGAPQAFSSAVTGTTTFAGALSLSGSGTWVLDRDLMAASTHVQGGTLQLGAGGTAGSLGEGPITNDGVLAIRRSDALAIANAISGSGALRQDGIGTTTLAGLNTYTGGTTVNAGTLAINGAVAGDVQVNDGGTLGGAGRIGGNVAVADGGTLSPGNSPGTLTVTGDLSLAAAATSVFQLGQAGVAGGTRNDLVNVGGDLALGGELKASASSAGWYRLFSYGGQLSGRFDSEAVGSAQPGFTVTSHQVDFGHAGQVNLAVLGAGQTMQFWNGGHTAPTNGVQGGSGTWANFGTNWSDDRGANPGGWAGSVAVFGGLAGTVSVEGTQSFDTLQFSADDYRVQAATTGGALAIAPASGSQGRINVDAKLRATIDAPIVDGTGDGLVKVGSGTLVLSGANSYSGGTTVAEGTLVAASNGALGAIGVTVDDTAGRAATLQVNAGVSLGNAVVLNHGGTLNNAGLVTGSGANGIVVNSLAGGATVNNVGGSLIAIGAGGTGVFIDGSVGASPASGVVRNSQGGVITADAFGVQIWGTGSVTNQAGTIRATGVDGRGVEIGVGAGTVLNQAGGLIEGTVFGVDLFDGGHVANDTGGVIRATGAGPLAAGVGIGGGAGSVTNTGAGSLIEGTAFGVRLVDGGRVSNGAGATIKGPVAVQTVGGSTALSNAGTLAGDVQLDGRSANQVTLFTGSTVQGRLNIGTQRASTLTLDGAGTQLYSQAVTGATTFDGQLLKQGSGSWTLDRANTHAGATTVAAGRLSAGAANVLSSVSAHGVASGATLDTAGFDQRIASLANAGTVSLRGAAGAGSTLAVTGPYIGNGGVLQVGTVLGDSASLSDRLLLSGPGAVASGSTQVQVSNVGGLGALTTGHGIAVVATENGGRIDGNAFSLAGGHVDAGVYEYRMTTDGTGAYLRSTDASTPLYRAEAVLVAAVPEQLREANLAMLGNRHQRVGDEVAVNANSGDIGARQAWGRVLTVQRDIQQSGTLGPSSQGRLTGFQAGTDLFTGAAGAGRWQAGLYVGQLDGDLNASGFARGIAGLQVGRTDLKNQYLGAYGSWQAENPMGRFYAEGVLQAGRHRSTLEAHTGGGGRSKGSSLLASLEVGQSFAVAPGWRIEPQLQLVHHRLSLDDFTLSGLTTVGQDTASGWTVRAGVRVQGEAVTGLGALKPYGRLNVYKSPNGTDVASYRTPAALSAIATPTGGSRTEVAAGAVLALGERTSVYGEIGQLWASGGSTRTKGGVNASVGLKLRW